jgi:glycosyltransferase involved in cell wall biosynthesis
MRIAFFYPSNNVRVPFDPGDLFTSPRGMTGSEGSCVHYAMSMAKLGHAVTLFTKVTRPGEVEGVIMCPYEEWQQTYCQQDWDALCSWMTPEPLKHAKPGTFRLFDQQVSDFLGCEPHWESYVDILAPLSNSHANYLTQYTGFDRDRWRVAYNGVDCEKFRPQKKVPGKCIWASSHDRGLHWLLEAWPRVRAKVPHASLHIFYDFNGVEVFSKHEGHDPSTVPGRNFNELGQRSRYTLEALRRMEGKHGVHTYKSVSRDRIREEMSTSSVLAYPLDPIHYTETFGVTVLEACASGTVPVICAADCFNELWAPVSEHVPPPYPEHKGEFVAKLVDILNNTDKAAIRAVKCIEHARKFDWGVLSRTFERTLQTRGQDGMPRVTWGVK